MSWEKRKHALRCEDCGHEGAVISGPDDWGQYSTEYEGFKTAPRDPKQIIRSLLGHSRRYVLCARASRECLSESFQEFALSGG
jgi:hypothetical protein